MPRKSSEQLIYCFICENPGLNTYQISKKLKMSGGKVRHALKKLREKGLIKFKFERKNPRIRKLTYPTEFWNLIPGSLRSKIKKLEKF
ncbi:MAG: winged helix-turn-helix domain-containing protein [Candidatus Aenigmatarchaeota archaeon]